MPRRKKVKEDKPNTLVNDREEEFKKAPHSFVINRGHVGKNVSDLVLDIRRVMEPYTASKLRTRKKNVLKDFVTIAGPLNVTHLLLLSKTESSTNLRISRLPRGPTLTFKVNEYSLVKDVISSLKRHNMDPKQFKHHPLLVLNNFSGDGMEMKLMTTMFQNMFPSITINKLNLSEVKRTVLLNYDADSKTVDFRHYNIRAVPVGMGKAVKKLIRSKVPDLHNFQDISDFVYRGGNLSESEGEMDGPQNQVTLPQHVPGRGNIKSAQSAIRLTEIGPRMKLQLIKIEEGVCSGPVLFHEFVTKSEEELKNLKEFREKKRKLKEQRKKEQAENVRRKETEKEKLKEKSIAGQKKDDTDSEDGALEADVEEEKEMDDADYYREEVGEEPAPELFPASHSHGGKRKFEGKSGGFPPRKRGKFDKPQKGRDVDKRVGGFKKDGKQFQKSGRDFKGKDKEFSKGGRDFKGKDKDFRKGGRDFKGKDKDFRKGKAFSGKDGRGKAFGGKDKRFAKKRDFSKAPGGQVRKGHSKVGGMKSRGKR